MARAVPPKTTKPKIEHKKIGRHHAVGLAYKKENLIVIDERQKGKDYLDTAIHELLHIYLPNMLEAEVNQLANNLTESLWDLKIRRVDE